MSWRLERADREVSKCEGLGGCGALHRRKGMVSVQVVRDPAGPLPKTLHPCKGESPPRSMTYLGRMMKIFTFLRPSFNQYKQHRNVGAGDPRIDYSLGQPEKRRPESQVT